MIVSCAPFRVSFAGRNSDVAQFYRRQCGTVLSCAIASPSHNADRAMAPRVLVTVHRTMGLQLRLLVSGLAP